MSWKMINQPRTQLATKKLAREFVEMDGCPHDRPLSERRLKVYERIIKEGGFRPVSWASASCGETSGTYRVNGKHTSILLNSIEPLPDLYVVVERYYCDTLEDVARLYATYDSRMQSRTVADINMSFAATVPELAELRRNTINLSVSGMAYHLGLHERTQPAERAELLLEYKTFPPWLEIMCWKGDDDSEVRGSSKHLMRQPVVAAMYGTWMKHETQSTTFWGAVRDETGQTPDLPDRKLARYLLTAVLREGTKASERAKKVMPREIYVRAIKAWNSWRKEEPTELRYHPDAPVPKIA